MIIQMKKINNFIRRNIVLLVAGTLALITCIFVPIDAEYLNYFEINTLMSLFCILAVVSGLKSTNIFKLISRKMILAFHNTRNIICVLVFGIFIFDLIIANDMSLITFLPLTYIVLSSTKNKKYLAITFVLQTIAANMAGMITPHGNPQNLYLYSYFNIETLEFFKILLPEFIATAILLYISILFIPKKKLEIDSKEIIKINKLKLAVYIILFIITMLSIFRIIHNIINLISVIFVLLFYDRKNIKEVDYGLILSFCMFFIFSGNIARIPQIKMLIYNIVNKNTLIAGVLLCQLISNVPTAIFLSKFTTNYNELLAAVNLGSLGVMISSLASLITFKEYLKHTRGKILKYIGTYTLINTVFFVILIIIYTVLK